ncbi:putative Exo70 exocyst complex subunit [Blattamonas nauphoetae]|uniref:Exocyst subunit Exo70 family protein n=1 Tax=Blattamonas nauphoetae TaxID=2049346 RepID=A0ABQ9XDT7_9EUKA|nr:putative Exo70 exocyst complex subunit [Blattamonas nauphoetae]
MTHQFQSKPVRILVQQEEQKLDAIRTKLALFEQTSGYTSDILNDFDERFTTLHNKVKPLVEKTKINKIKHKNLNDAIKSMESTFDRFQIPMTIQHTLSREPQLKDLTSYLRTLDQALVNIKTLNTLRSTYGQSANKVLSDYRVLLNQTYEILERKYSEALTLFGTMERPEEMVFKYNFTKHETLLILPHLSSYLDEAERKDYQKKYQEIRTQAMQSNCEPLEEQRSRFIDMDGGEGMYVINSHPVLKFIDHMLSIFQFERSVMSAAIGFNESIYEPIIRPAVDLFCSIVRAVCLSSSQSIDEDIKILDVIQAIMSSRNEFIQAFKDTKYALQQFAECLVSAGTRVKALLTEHTLSVANSIKPITLNATVHPCASASVLYMRRLLEFPLTVSEVLKENAPFFSAPQLCIKSLTMNLTASFALQKTPILVDDPTAIYSTPGNPAPLWTDNKPVPNGKKIEYLPVPESTLLRCSGLISTVEGILEQLSNTLQAKADVVKNKGHVHVFLMNNFHYISQTINVVVTLRTVVTREREENIRKRYEMHRKALLEHYMSTLIPSLETNVEIKRKGNDREPRAPMLKISRNAIKEKWNTFNIHFESMLDEISTFTITNESLRQEVVKDFTAELLPAYTKFFNTYNEEPFTERKEKYLKTTPQQLGMNLANIFKADKSKR